MNDEHFPETVYLYHPDALPTVIATIQNELTRADSPVWREGSGMDLNPLVAEFIGAACLDRPTPEVRSAVIQSTIEVLIDIERVLDQNPYVVYDRLPVYFFMRDVATDQTVAECTRAEAMDFLRYAFVRCMATCREDMATIHVDEHTVQTDESVLHSMMELLPPLYCDIYEALRLLEVVVDPDDRVTVVDIDKTTILDLRVLVNAAVITLTEACEPTPIDNILDDEDLTSTDKLHEQMRESLVLVNYAPVLCEIYRNRFLLVSTKQRMKPIIKIIGENLLNTITYPASPRPTAESVRIDLTGPYSIFMSEEEVARNVAQKQDRWDTREQDTTQYLAQFYEVRDVLEDFIPGIAEQIGVKHQEYRGIIEAGQA